MAAQVIMPQFGESVVEGTVGKWLVAEGQRVREYEPLLQVTTDKVDTEIPAPASGILLKVYVAEGQTVPKGTLLAEIGEEDEAALSGVGGQGPGVRGQESAISHQPLATPVAQRMAAEHGVDLASVRGTGPGGRITREDVEAHLAVSEGETEAQAPTAQSAGSSGPNLRASSLGFISPVVARLAGELDVDLTEVIGTGQGGRITKKDVLAYVAAPVPRAAASRSDPGVMAEPSAWAQLDAGFLFESLDAAGVLPTDDDVSTEPPPSAEDVEIVPLSAIRRGIARHMILSKQTSPHVTTVMEADMTHVVQARERLQGEFAHQGVKLTYTPFFIQAIIAGLRAVPEVNSSLRDSALAIHRRIHIGVAVATLEGLIVPVIRDADEKSLLGLARAVNDLAERARTKRLAPEEVQGGTFTLTNHGTAGSLFATPIIVQPQAGILGIGAIVKRPVVVSRGHPLLPDAEDSLVIRPMVYLSFAFDHRILDGQGADGFLGAVKKFLESYRE